MYKVKKYNCIEDFDNAVSNIMANEAKACDSTTYHYSSVIIELKDDEVVFYDFYPSRKVIKRVTKEIEYNNNGEPYFMWCKKKYHIKDFLRMKI